MSRGLSPGFCSVRMLTIDINRYLKSAEPTEPSKYKGQSIHNVTAFTDRVIVDFMHVLFSLWTATTSRCSHFCNIALWKYHNTAQIGIGI